MIKATCIFEKHTNKTEAYKVNSKNQKWFPIPIMSVSFLRHAPASLSVFFLYYVCTHTHAMYEEISMYNMQPWNSLAFSMIQRMLAIWSLVPLPFLNPAWTSGSSLNILLKPSLENFEHYFARVRDDCNCVVVWTFFGIALLWAWNENWPFPVLVTTAEFSKFAGIVSAAISQQHLFFFFPTFYFILE